MQQAATNNIDTELFLGNIGLFAAHINYDPPTTFWQAVKDLARRFIFRVTGYPANKRIDVAEPEQAQRRIQAIGDSDVNTDMFVIADPDYKKSQLLFQHGIDALVGPMVEAKICWWDVQALRDVVQGLSVTPKND